MTKQFRVARSADSGRLIGTQVKTGGHVVVTRSGQVFRSSRDILFRSEHSNVPKGSSIKGSSIRGSSIKSKG
jgi:hypothetical protein